MLKDYILKTNKCMFNNTKQSPTQFKNKDEFDV